jgi:Transglutaminase-like superfamily
MRGSPVARIDRRPDTLSLGSKVALLLRVWGWFITVRLGLHRYPLPELINRLGRTPRKGPRSVGSARLSRIVTRCLRVGGYQPRCLTSSLVLYGLLREQGEPAQLVIGLPQTPKEKAAHAWVEVNGIDVGPHPGRGGFVEFARYG